MTTTDFSLFGWRERKLAAALLNASIEQGFPDDFEDDGVQIMMNKQSGNVFFTNSEFQVAMMNDDKLESFYSCPTCGHEGFKEDMAHEGGGECTRYQKEIGVEVDEEEEEASPDIADDDIRLNHIPDVKECRQLRKKMDQNKFWPNVWHINERGNTDLLAIGHNGAKIVKSWV